MIVAESYKRELLTLQPASYLAADRGFLVGSCLIAGLTLLALLLQGVLGWNASYIAACGAVALLALNYKELVQLVKRRDYRSVWQGLRETQLLFFFGLFIMIGGLTYAGITRIYCSERVRNQSRKHPLLIHSSVMAYWIWLCHDGLYSLYSCYDSSRRTYGQHAAKSAGIPTVSCLMVVFNRWNCRWQRGNSC